MKDFVLVDISPGFLLSATVEQLLAEADKLKQVGTKDAIETANMLIRVANEERKDLRP